MKTNKFGEMIFNEIDLCEQIMEGRPVWNIKNITVDTTISLGKLINSLEDTGSLLTWRSPDDQEDRKSVV